MLYFNVLFTIILFSPPLPLSTSPNPIVRSFIVPPLYRYYINVCCSSLVNQSIITPPRRPVHCWFVRSFARIIDCYSFPIPIPTSWICHNPRVVTIHVITSYIASTLLFPRHISSILRRANIVSYHINLCYGI
jgi:hypothetical protein